MECGVVRSTGCNSGIRQHGAGKGPTPVSTSCETGRASELLSIPIEGKDVGARRKHPTRVVDAISGCAAGSWHLKISHAQSLAHASPAQRGGFDRHQREPLAAGGRLPEDVEAKALQ